MALGVGPGDTVWTSPNTFVASSNAALYCGANVDFVDIDLSTYNISISALKRKLERSKLKTFAEGHYPVHLTGQPCDMRAMRELSKQYGFKVVEDASHAIGGRYLSANVEIANIVT